MKRKDKFVLFSNQLISQFEPPFKVAARSKNISDMKRLCDKRLTETDVQHARILGTTQDAYTTDISEPF